MPSNSSGSLRLLVIAGAVLAVLASFHPQPSPATELKNPTTAQLEEMARLIGRHYVRALPPDSLMDAARRCFAHTLDPYAAYLDADETGRFEDELGGKFGGVGASVTQDTVTGVVCVTMLYRNSPALAAGVRAGDTLVAVDGRASRGRDFDQLIDGIRGRVGTSVRLLVRRPGETGERTFVLRRAVIERPSVRGLTLAASDEGRYLADAPTRTAYIRIEYFSKRTPAEFDSALAAVKRIGARALVLDLRDDPGGMVASAEAVADQFLESGTIVTMQSRGEPDEVVAARAGVGTSLPLALLVNAHTTSASELLASCLQDNHRAIVVGSRSFGKGVALQIYRLKRTPGIVKLTTMVYLPPSGRMIEGHIPGMSSDSAGVWPDPGLTVPLSDDEERRWSDAAYHVTERLLVAGSEADTTTAPPDRVLERAVAALKSVRPR